MKFSGILKMMLKLILLKKQQEFEDEYDEEELRLMRINFYPSLQTNQIHS